MRGPAWVRAALVGVAVGLAWLSWKCVELPVRRSLFAQLSARRRRFAVIGLALACLGLVYAVGDNAEACDLSGIRVWRVLLVNYTLCGLFAATAGLVIVGGTDAADLSLADVYLLPSVASVIIGGTSIFGGRGGYAGTIVGALILTVLNSILTLLDAPEPIRKILYGAIILVLAAAYTRLTD